MAMGVAGILALSAGPALAVHEANNQFDLAVTTSAFPAADGRGFSNYVAGTDSFKNRVDVSGLAPNTSYSWYGGANTLICSFVTDDEGAGGCESEVNSRLSVSQVRDTTTNAVVLQATDFQDEDQKISDGEIERRGTCRDEANPRCEAPGRG